MVSLASIMAQDTTSLRKERDRLSEKGMWKDLLVFYQEKLAPLSDAASGEDLRHASDAIGQLGAWGDFDAVVENAIFSHPDNSPLLVQAAKLYQEVPHEGHLVAGQFVRAGVFGIRFGRGGSTGPADVPGPEAGSQVDTSYRDQVRAFQLLRSAVSKATSDDEKYQVWETFGEWLGDSHETWKLQTLTPLEVLPEWGEPGPEGGTEGAPWAKDGPVMYEIPQSWEAAKNDGERWRFALAERARLKPNEAAQATFELAQFLRSEFGTETLQSYRWWRSEDPETTKGLLEMDTLAEDECLAKTSDGVRRFKLPASYHFIALFRSIMHQKAESGDALVECFLNRHQFDKARDVLKEVIADHGPGDQNTRNELLKQITGNWGRFEAAATVPVGVKPSLPLVFRNAANIKISAAPVDMDAVLRETIDLLKKNPNRLDFDQINPSRIADRIIREKTAMFVGKTTVSFDVSLTPNDKHRNTRKDIDLPLDRAGAWWITGEVAGGNQFHTLVWVIDSVLVQKDVGGMKMWWVADAATGAPVAGAEISYFGYRQVYEDRTKPGDRRFNIFTKEFSRSTDEEGKALLKPGDWAENFLWLAIAKKAGRTTAFYGFQPYYLNASQLENGNRDSTYGITDRPLYKPGDTVHLKFYFRNVGYFQPDESRWSNKSGVLSVSDGRGQESVSLKNLKTDELGAVEAEIILPKDAVLGNWNGTFSIGDEAVSSVNFRVEEFRKPEYEVTVEAPAEPVRLGDKFTATVRATYFHGAPVRNANVEIIVKRSSMGDRWFPGWRWDWLYSVGAWWTGSEATWHPTWERWGCLPPHPPWWQGERWMPDELVMKRNVPIDADGTAKIEVDTALAKQIHSDIDAKYNIEARVVDASRREERGASSVIAARKPFEVVVWMDRGYGRAGDPVEAHISAATLAGKPVVAAKGTLKIYRLQSTEGGKIEEKEIQSMEIVTDAEGEVRQKFAAPATGQYRIAASLSFNGGEAAEGASIFNVHGPGRANPGDWQFGPLELVTDKASYAPGETLKLRVNSDQQGANVWLFLHVAGSAGREARRVQLDGKSLVVEVPLDDRDMPNMFIEGITVFNGKVHQSVRQVLLPPVSKVIDVTLEPAKNRVKPREKSALKVLLRDMEGKPVTGKAVITIYDKALEAITGGSNVGSIQENFWAWKNHYYPSVTGSSIPNSAGNLTREKETEMKMLGQVEEVSKVRALGRSGGKGMGMGMSKSFAMDMTVSESALGAAPASAPAPAAAPILVRKDFADLLKWSGSVVTDADGCAEIPLEFPDNLTTWKARVWIVGKGTQVGEGTAEIITSKELLVRLQAPRFLVERDESVVSAIVQNDHDVAKTVNVSLEMEGGVLETGIPLSKSVEIAPRSEARVDWRVKALKEGEATLRMKADAGDDGDAVERKLPVVVHGMLRQDAWSRVVEPDAGSAKIDFNVPAERRVDQTKLTIRFSPSIAGAVVDAIPYLASFPHGCTEQTLNRFVPAVVTRKMLKDLNIDLAEIKAKRANLNPQELGDAGDRASQWKVWQSNPVFDDVEIDRMISAGLEKLMTMQNGDGGWGWFSGYGEKSYPHTTAVVVHGLLIARNNGAAIPNSMLDRGIGWLVAYEREQTDGLQLCVEREALRKKGEKIPNSSRYVKSKADSLDAFVRLVLGEAKREGVPMLAFLYRDRVELPVYARCLLGIELQRTNDESRRDEVLTMIGQFLKRDAENQTAYLDIQNSGNWWNWYGSEVEANAWYLKLLTAVKPRDADTRGLVKYLVNNRKNATYWESTRDTAYAVEAIASYFKASGEDAPEMNVEVLMDGKSLSNVSINRQNLFTFPGTITLAGKAVPTGDHQIELRRTGKGALYGNAYLEVFTLEDKLRSAGLEVKVSRHVSKLVSLEKTTEVPDAVGTVVKQNVERFRREPLADGARVSSGDRIEVELVLESKNDYEYLVFSDAKAAGFEAVEALSGYINSNDGFSAYMEPKDRSVNFFIRALPRGTHTLKYQLRAEAPGIYKALPATVEGMYARELRGNSEDFKVEISE